VSAVNKKDLKHFRARLLEELDKIATSLDRFERNARESSQRDSSGDLSAYATHSADMGTDAMEREKDMMLASRESRTVLLIREALRKNDAGTYGACEECGEPIGVKRLELIPYAQFCTRCQVKAERNAT
jgi:RNA polymerase-binding protein DksA